jgi:SAM-dependent methyltransferase
MNKNYNQIPVEVIQTTNRQISVFSIEGRNIDEEVVKSFGEEWHKFQNFSDEIIATAGIEYFDILNETIINKNSYVVDIGCGTGRWTKYLSQKAAFIEAVDPSEAIFAADNLLAGISNVRLTKASIERMPFDDNTFDLAMSVGVLHHIPNTQKAMQDCIKKIKAGGYFYCYLYHNLETMGWFRKTLFTLSELIRKVVCRLPASFKRFVCDILACVIYMPLVFAGRIVKVIGLKNIAEKMPLSSYYNKPFFIIRNDALDKFGTKLEQRFSKVQVEEMMKNCGLENIVISSSQPLYHAIGRKK